MNIEDLSSQDLADALQRLPGLAPHALAACQLVVSHRYWLRRLDFQTAVVVEVHSGLIYADIDWPSAAYLADNLHAPESESAVLRFACLLLGQGPAPSEDERWSLRYILGVIDDDRATASTVTPLIITALAMAATGGRM